MKHRGCGTIEVFGVTTPAIHSAENGHRLGRVMNATAQLGDHGTDLWPGPDWIRCHRPQRMRLPRCGVVPTTLPSSWTLLRYGWLMRSTDCDRCMKDGGRWPRRARPPERPMALRRRRSMLRGMRSDLRLAIAVALIVAALALLLSNLTGYLRRR
jgi:hypothetical protein